MMNIKDIKLGEYYRLKNNNIAWAKPIKIYKPKEFDKNKNYFIIKCEWSQDKNDTFGLIKHFRLDQFENNNI